MVALSLQSFPVPRHKATGAQVPLADFSAICRQIYAIYRFVNVLQTKAFA
jgi:hypothetical protein